MVKKKEKFEKIEKKEKRSKSKEEILSLKKYVIDYSKRCIEIETDKEKILTKNFNNMIIFNSILLIPLISVLIELCVRVDHIRLLILIFGLILVGIVFVSLLLSMFGQNLNRGYFTTIGSFIFDELDSSNKTIDEETIINKTIEELDSIYVNKKYYNIKRSKLLMASHIVIYGFYALLFAFSLVIMIVM